MKRYELHGDDAWYDESASGEWVSYEDAEQAERERDEARERLEQAVALLRDCQTADCNSRFPLKLDHNRIDAFLAGQPAPANTKQTEE